MTIQFKKHGRILSVIILIALAATLIPVALNGYNSTAAAMSGFTEDDRQMAADISNTTGVSIEDVLALKNQGKTWNEVLERLKKEAGSHDNREQRDERLLNDTLANEDVEALIKEGFSQEEIMEAKLLAERVIFQLQQITGDNQPSDRIPKVETDLPGDSKDEEEDISSYVELAGRMDEKTAVTLILKLKTDFGSFEQVLDEYLFTLQTDMNLEDYFSDKASYAKSKTEKSLAMSSQKLITLSTIEEKLLKKIQASNKDIQPAGTNIPENLIKPEKTGATADIPQEPEPTVEDVNPQNPAQEIMNEIKLIDPMQNRR